METKRVCAAQIRAKWNARDSQRPVWMASISGTERGWRVWLGSAGASSCTACSPGTYSASTGQGLCLIQPHYVRKRVNINLLLRPFGAFAPPSNAACQNIARHMAEAVLGSMGVWFGSRCSSDRDRNSVQSANQSKKQKVRVAGHPSQGGEGLMCLTWARRLHVLHRLLPRNLLRLHRSRPVLELRDLYVHHMHPDQ